MCRDHTVFAVLASNEIVGCQGQAKKHNIYLGISSGKTLRIRSFTSTLCQPKRHTCNAMNARLPVASPVCDSRGTLSIMALDALGRATKDGNSALSAKTQFCHHTFLTKRASDIKVFCFFSSEKKIFLPQISVNEHWHSPDL